jgi:phage FluMu protein Com
VQSIRLFCAFGKATQNYHASIMGRNLQDNGMRDKEDAPQIRCGNCDKLLGKGTALDLAIKCPRCGCINHIQMSDALTSKEGLKPQNEADNGKNDSIGVQLPSAAGGMAGREKPTG